MGPSTRSPLAVLSTLARIACVRAHVRVFAPHDIHRRRLWPLFGVCVDGIDCDEVSHGYVYTTGCASADWEVRLRMGFHHTGRDTSLYSPGPRDNYEIWSEIAATFTVHERLLNRVLFGFMNDI